MREENQPPGYAGFWLRALAMVIDGVILFTPGYWLSLQTTSPWLKMVCVWLLPYFAEVGFWQCKLATPAKLLLGLIVVRDADHQRLGWWRGTLRYWAEVPAFFFLGLGFFWVAFDPKKRGLHDYIAGSVVLRTSSASPPRVAAALLLVAVIVMGGSGWWAWRYFGANQERFKSMGKTAIAEGQSFGAGHTQRECLMEALQRLDACDSLLCEVGVNLFFGAGARVATPSPGFCDAVPAKGEILKTAAWQTSTCQALGHPALRCQRLLNVFFDICPPAGDRQRGSP